MSDKKLIHNENSQKKSEKTHSTSQNITNLIVLLISMGQLIYGPVYLLLERLGFPVYAWKLAIDQAITLLYKWTTGHLGILLIPLIVVIALGLFALRGHWPKTYGLLEIMVGIWAVNRVDLLQISTETAFGALGGMYIMIRGLDNIAKGLEGGWLKTLFSDLFNNPRPSTTESNVPQI